ncbi:MAG: PorT family protein [Prevotella sp.]|nr:PorT family protein [Prevotella sp.]
MRTAIYIYKVYAWHCRPALVLLLAVLTFSTARAQIGEHRNEFAVGFSGGYVVSNVGFTPNVQQGLHGGLTGGVTFRYTTEKYFSSICAIVGEVNYAQLGWKEDILDTHDAPVINAVTGLAEQYERTINYVQVPVLARLGWGRERNGAQFFFQIGPQMGFYLNESTKTNFNFADRNTTDRSSSIVAQDTMAVKHKFDYGIVAGIGVEYSVPRVGHFILEGRYYYGLGNIYGNTKSDYFGKSNFGNIVIKLSYLFDITRTKNDKIK